MHTRLCVPCANKESKERYRKQRELNPPKKTCECGVEYLTGRGIRRCSKCTIAHQQKRYRETVASGNSRRSPEQKDRQTRSRTARNYGLTLAEYDELCTITECQICNGPTLKPDDRRKRPSIDHDHATGKVRGVLCHDCNLMLGHAKDNPAILRAGAKYVIKHRDTITAMT